MNSSLDNALIKSTWLRVSLLQIIVKIDRLCRDKCYVAVKIKKNLERFTNLRVILAQGPC